MIGFLRRLLGFTPRFPKRSANPHQCRNCGASGTGIMCDGVFGCKYCKAPLPSARRP